MSAITLQSKPNRKVAKFVENAPEAPKAAKNLGIRGLRPIASALKIDGYSFLDLRSLAFVIAERVKTNDISLLNHFRTDELNDLLRIATGDIFPHHKKSQLVVQLAHVLKS